MSTSPGSPESLSSDPAGLAHPLTFNEEQMLRLFVTDPRSMAYNLSNTQRCRVPLTVEQPGRIAVGQAILEVNGATDVREMLQQFRNARRVEVLIQPQLTREQRLVFQSSMVKHQRSVMAREVLQLVPTPEANGSQPDAATVEACSICHEAMELKKLGRKRSFEKKLLLLCLEVLITFDSHP
eukprot:Skav220236  [mRNA]  locus=scaffold4245:83499:88325:- [translate_table: standard]